jgi:ankyrin repeat protein
MKYLITTIAALLLVGCGPNIHEATWTGNIELIKQLTDSNIDVNVKRDRGETPLHIAARFSYYEVAKLLISKGANVNAETDSGATPLDVANTWDHRPAADLLRKHGGKTAEELKAAGN